MNRTSILLVCAFLCVTTFCGTFEWQATGQTQSRSGRELFYSDSLNALARTRTYPVPDVEYTAAPEGYQPVYISSYARHGSRNPASLKTTSNSIKVLADADEAGHLTPFGKEVLGKLALIEDAIRNTLGDLTPAGVEQHRGIAERMCLNYPTIFSGDGTPVRLYSTMVQRTMLSMFACNEGLLKYNPNINSTRQASTSLTFLEAKYENPQKLGGGATHDFISDYFDPQPALDRLFTGEVPALKDTVALINNLYDCGSYVHGMGLTDASFIWDLFTMDELFILQQAVNYHMYVTRSNSPQLAELSLPAAKPLLNDFLKRAEAALEQEVPGADLRFGHDTYLMELESLLGINGPVKKEEDRLKVLDTFQDFIFAPMAGNLQMVFYRNGSGDTLVKFLQNEVEAGIPIDTDSYPYYHWNNVRDYIVSLIEN